MFLCRLSLFARYEIRFTRDRSPDQARVTIAGSRCVYRLPEAVALRRLSRTPAKADVQDFLQQLLVVVVRFFR
jgi:hypothetical protein